MTRLMISCPSHEAYIECKSHGYDNESMDPYHLQCIRKMYDITPKAFPFQCLVLIIAPFVLSIRWFAHPFFPLIERKEGLGLEYMVEVGTNILDVLVLDVVSLSQVAVSIVAGIVVHPFVDLFRFQG